MIFFGQQFVFGAKLEPKPLSGFPPGAVKIKMRPDDFVRVYIRTADGIQCFSCKEADDSWTPGCLIGANKRIGGLS